MSEQEGERTAGGFIGRAVGKAKEAVGTATGNEDLTREGRLQQAQSDTGREARRTREQAREQEERADRPERQAGGEGERERLCNQVVAQRQEEQIETDRRAERLDPRAPS